MGPVLVEALKADIKPALMSSVETACKSNPHDPSAEPRRVARAGKGAAGKAAKASGSAAKRDSGTWPIGVGCDAHLCRWRCRLLWCLRS